jgi:hypothetical protein
MADREKTVQIDIRRKAAPGAVDALFDAFAAPSARLLAFSAAESEGEISAQLIAEAPHEARRILERAGFECCAGPANP